MYKVKVCGVTTADILNKLNQLTPDYVGFILTSGFKRSVSEDFAARARLVLDEKIKTVGVFVNDDAAKIARLANSGIINLIQLHGDENAEYIRRLKGACNAPVIKSAGVCNGKVLPYPDNCDYVLLDAYAPAERGGTGRKVEWRRYGEIDKPFFLAGGITPENVKQAITSANPYCVDCSGGVETDGVKDIAKIEKYIKNVRECD